MSIEVTFYEYGTNNVMGTQTMNSDAVPRVGEYLVFDEAIKDDYVEHMYIVKCVTNLLPKKNTFAGNKCVHLEKFNPIEEAKKVEELEAKIKKIAERGKSDV